MFNLFKKKMALRVKDLEKGVCYTFSYQKNKCVTYVYVIKPGIVRCKYIVGFWDDSEAYEQHDINHVAIDVNLKDYEKDITDLRRGTLEDVERYKKACQQRTAPVTLGDVIGASGVQQLKKAAEVYEPSTVKKPSVKVVGKVEELNKKAANVVTPSKPSDSFDVMAWMENNHNTRFAYKDEQILSFSYAGRDGIAIGRVDELRRECGYYIALNLENKKDKITVVGEKVEGMTAPGGTWPAGIKLQEAGFAAEYVGQTLLKEFRADIDKYHAMQETLRQQLLQQHQEEEQVRDEQLDHLPYVRGDKELDEYWPQVPFGLAMSRVWFTKHIFAVLVEKMVMLGRKYIVRTYVLSETYLNEMRKRQEGYMNQYKSFADFKHKWFGVLAYRQDNDDYQLFFYLQPGENTLLRMAVLKNGELVAAQSDIDNGPFKSHKMTEGYLTSYISRGVMDSFKVLLLSFLAMEVDAENVILQKCESGENEVEYRRVEKEDARYDVELRNATWYTTFFVNKQIVVDSYLGHRWCGSGDDKHLEERIIRGYVKNGYTRTAGVAK